MTRPRFGEAVEAVAKEVLENRGFRKVRIDEPGYGSWYYFSMPWKKGLVACIGVYPARGKQAFAVELGVVPEEGNFYRAAFSEAGPWRTTGLRQRLGILLQPGRTDLDPFERDFVSYRSQEDLIVGLRKTLNVALGIGPQTWESLAARLR